MYDRYGQDIISPLLNVKELREMGITLHLYVDCPLFSPPFATRGKHFTYLRENFGTRFQVVFLSFIILFLYTLLHRSMLDQANDALL